MKIARILSAPILALTLLLAAASPLAHPANVEAAGLWHGWISSDAANVRAAPTRAAAILRELPHGTAVQVAEWVEGETVIGKNNLWGRLADGGYVHTSLLRTKVQVTPPPTTFPGRWVDVNLTSQVVTAYEGSTPVYSALSSTGRPGWETPEGTFKVQRRVYNETMTSASLAVDVPAGDDYNLPNVLFTQYFTQWGNAFHLNYWKWDSPFGVPTSHGCVGLEYKDAEFFWNFMRLGTTISIHR